MWKQLALFICWGALWCPAVAAETPVAYWGFGQEEASPLRPQGGVHRDIPGPRSPEYPDFPPDNTAVRFDGNGSRYEFADPGVESEFDFTNGDEITLEAWVQVEKLGPGQNVYLIGKGRTGTNGFGTDQQNWALRIREMQDQACVSFLFSTPRQPDQMGGEAHWHRWTSSRGFQPGKQWHHVAVTYRFGQPESIQAVIDGQLLPGKWDMGGATKRAPVVDNDAIWIGSSIRGSASTSLRGALDDVAIYRRMLSPKELQARYRGPEQPLVKGPQAEVMPELGPLPAGAVQVTLHENMPSHDRWLLEGEEFPAESMRYQTTAFLFKRLPERFDDWGIRTNWKPPVLMRVAADVELPSGSQKLLLRVRGLSRLWVDGVLVARSQPITSAPNGEERITPVANPPVPGNRIAEHRQQEIIVDALIGDSGRARVVLETLVGGKRFHTIPGETCLAWLTPGGETYALLTPAGVSPAEWPLTDAVVETELKQQEQRLRALDETHRRQAGASQLAHWQQRHQHARDWVSQHPAPQPPSAQKHPIDAFLEEKIAQAKTTLHAGQSPELTSFHTEVLPLLKNECFRCHGKKDNGGLRLNTWEAARQGGDSGLAGVTPGDLDDSEIIRRILSEDVTERMPPGEAGLSDAQKQTLVDWVAAGAVWPEPQVTAEELTLAAVIDDATFARRAALDLIGVPLDAEVCREFLESTAVDKREQLIDQLLAEDRWADHWMGYWQDILAENPTLINKSLNTTGPFRWFLYDAFRDNKPLDQLVTELIQQRGHVGLGGSAGFGLAGDNDAPSAAKGQILASAFLGIDLQCARCHDSPYHSTKQSDLFALAAMLDGKSTVVPKSSRVPAAFFEKQLRASLIQVSLKPDEQVPPVWPFAKETGIADDESLALLMQNPNNSRERLATLITAPANTRFAEVIVNRVWRRFLGAGLIEPPDDWEGQVASHPELLTWLARDFVAHGYDLKHLVRTILTSQAYQRQAVGENRIAEPGRRFFTAPDRRRLTAEQILDSLHVSAGQEMFVEELTFDPDGRAVTGGRISLGTPERAWMFANLANERDRPSLNLPKARALTDVLEAFGWSGARQNPRTDRELSPNVLQPGVLANGPVAQWLTRPVLNSRLADVAAQAESPERLVEQLFLQYLNRLPETQERETLALALTPGFNQRLLPQDEIMECAPEAPLPLVTWWNHLRPEANSIIIEWENRVHVGPPNDPRFRPEWRERYQDVVWSLVNLPELVWVP